MSDEEIRMYIPILRKAFRNYDELAKIWFSKESKG